MTDNAFNCPDSVYDAMYGENPPSLLVAARDLGPERVQWVGHPHKMIRSTAVSPMWTCWSVDGKRVRHGELLGLWAADRAGL